MSALFDRVIAYLAPLRGAAQSIDTARTLIAATGWDIDRIVGVPAEDILLHLEGLGEGISLLDAWIDQPPRTVEHYVQVLEVLDAIFLDLWALHELLEGGGRPPELAAFARDVAEGMACLALWTTSPVAYRIAVLLSLVEPAREVGLRPPVRDASLVAVRYPRMADDLRLSQVPALVGDPIATLRAEYVPSPGLETEANTRAIAHRLFPRLAGLLSDLGLNVSYGVNSLYAVDFGDSNAVVDRMLAVWTPESAGGVGGVTLALRSEERGEPGLVVIPWANGHFTADVGETTLTVDVTAGIEALRISGDDVELLGSPTGGEAVVRLEIARDTAFAVAGWVALTGTHHQVGIDVAVSAPLKVSKGSNGLLARLLPPEGIEIPVDASLEWRIGKGVSFSGGVGFDTTIPINKRVFGLGVQDVHLRLQADGGNVHGEATADFSAEVGPVRLTIHETGVAGELSFPADRGNLGIAQLDIEFVGPRAVGLVIDTGVVKGGGLLQIESGGRYLGSLVLDTHGIAASAVGVLETHMPSGGYSLAAAISAEFSAVALGLGFTLEGIGGLIGIHRRVATDALRAALRGDGIGNIFFSADPASQATRIVGDLASFFPVAEGRHVFGPAAKIGWGTPTLVEGVLALVLEVPDPVRLVLLGNVKTSLPTKDNPIIVLNVDVIGEVDFSKKTAAIDAALRDSKVAGFPITGDMAVRLAWGDPPSFAISVGGFHSQFRPPPGFPELRRIRIPIGSGDNPRLDIQGFLALTSNTAQVGAQAELYAEKAGLNILGTVGFEALFQFSPFSVMFDLWASVTLRRGSRVLASVNLDGTLTGPRPWHVAGEACLSLWLTDLCVNFEATFGEAETVELPERDIWVVLEPALVDPRSWSSALPPLSARAVTTAAPVGEDNPPVLIDPVSALSVRQKIVPLNRTIERFAQVEPDGLDHFHVTEVALGVEAVPAEFEPIADWFAPAQFEDLSNAERLSRPGYEKMVAGVSVASTAVRAGPELVKAFDYETVLIPDPPSPPGPYVPSRQWQIEATATTANATAPLRVGSLGRFSPPIGSAPLVALVEEEYVVASTEDLTWRLDVLENATSRSEAELALKAYLADNPAAHGQVQVVPRFEAVEAP
jgi:hypothetical protein